MTAEIIIGDHHFVQVVGANGTRHGLHCTRCGMDLWKKCVRCAVTIVPLNDDDRRVGRRVYCTPQCRKRAARERKMKERADRKAEKEARTK